MQEYKSVLTFGETGTGKSTIQNVLIGQTSIFQVSDSMKSQTKQCQQSKGNLFGDIRKPYIKVIDTPGFLDSSGSDDDILKYIYEMLVSLKEDGLNIILYCISATNIRCTKGIIDGLKLLQSLMGNEILSRTFIVVTQLNKLQDQDQKVRCDQISEQLPEVLGSAGIEINKSQILYYFHNQRQNGLEKIEEYLFQSQTFIPQILKDLNSCYDPDNRQKTLSKLISNSREMQNLQLKLDYERQQKIMHEQQQQETQKQLKLAISDGKQNIKQKIDEMKREHENQKQKLKNYFQGQQELLNLQQDYEIISEKNISQDFQTLQPNSKNDNQINYQNSSGNISKNQQFEQKEDYRKIKMKQLIQHLCENRPNQFQQLYTYHDEEKHEKLMDYCIKNVNQEQNVKYQDEKKQKKEFIEYLYNIRPWIFGKDKHNEFIKLFIQGY